MPVLKIKLPVVGLIADVPDLVVLVAMLGEDAPAQVTEDEGTSIYAEPRRLLASVFGTGMLAGILAQAREDLTGRVPSGSVTIGPEVRKGYAAAFRDLY